MNRKERCRLVSEIRHNKDGTTDHAFKVSSGQIPQFARVQ